LSKLKITANSVAALPHQQWGLARFVASNDRGGTLRISLYSRDARESQLFAKIYRNVVYRRDVAPFALTRVQQIEHEAYMTLLAHRAAPGRTAELVTTEVLGPSREALVVSASPNGRLLRELLEAGESPSTAAVTAMATALEALHAQDIAHGSIDCDHIVVDHDSAALVNFDRSASRAPQEASQLSQTERYTHVTTALSQHAADRMSEALWG
jgi:hypothetical protein